MNTAYDGLLAGTGAQQAPNGAVLIGADLAAFTAKLMRNTCCSK